MPGMGELVFSRGITNSLPEISAKNAQAFANSSARTHDRPDTSRPSQESIEVWLWKAGSFFMKADLVVRHASRLCHAATQHFTLLVRATPQNFLVRARPTSCLFCAGAGSPGFS